MKTFLPASLILVLSVLNVLKEEFAALPSRSQYIPDLVVAMIGAIVVARIVLLGRVALIPLRYWLVFLGFLYVVVSGAVLNDLSPDVAFAGIRFYFKYVPLFLLPFAFEYSEKDIKRLFTIVMVLAFVQIPLAFRQRFFTYADLLSGDVVTGTTASSGGLAVLGVALLMVVLAYYFDARVTPFRAVVLGCLFLAPASLAEVKVVPIFFAIGSLAVLLTRRDRMRSSRMIGAAFGGVLLIGSFVFVYDSLYSQTRGGEYVDLVASKDRALDRYLLKGMDALPFRAISEQEGLVAPPVRFKTDDRRVGRFDSIRMPFSSLLPSEGMKLALGLGIGNTFSTFGDGARFLFVRDDLGGSMTTITQLIWETGVFGMLFFVATVVLVGRDSVRLSRDQGFLGTLGAAWVGVTTVVAVELVYHNMFGLPVLASLFFLFSGVVATKATSAAKSRLAAAADAAAVRRADVRAHGSQRLTRRGATSV